MADVTCLICGLNLIPGSDRYGYGLWEHIVPADHTAVPAPCYPIGHITPAAEGYNAGLEGLPAYDCNPYITKDLEASKEFHEGWQAGFAIFRKQLKNVPVYEGLDYLEEKRE